MTITINGITIHCGEDGIHVLQTMGPVPLDALTVTALHAVIGTLDETMTAQCKSQIASGPLIGLLNELPALLASLKGSGAEPESGADLCSSDAEIERA